MFRTKSIISFIVLSLFLCSENAYSQATKRAPLLTKYASKPKAGKIVARSFASARLTGGVLSAGSTDVFHGADKTFIDPTRISFGDYYFDNDELCVHIDKSETCYRWQISEDRLSRLASFVDNKGIGLFSAFADNFEDAELGEDELEGYVNCEVVSSFEYRNLWCASEIMGSSLEQSFFDLDLHSQNFWNEEPRKNELIAEFNASLPTADIKNRQPSAWEISDLSSNFKIQLNQGKVVFGGTAHVFHRSVLEVSKQFAQENPSKVTREEPLYTLAEVEQLSDEELLFIDIFLGMNKENLIANAKNGSWYFNVVEITDIQSLNFDVLSFNEFRIKFADNPNSLCDDYTVDYLQSENEFSLQDAKALHQEMIDACKAEYDNYEETRQSVADAVKALHELAFLKLIRDKNPEGWNYLWRNSH